MSAPLVQMHEAVVRPGGVLAPAVLRGCSFTLAAGESAALVGESGAGKTTLLRALAGLIPPTSGRVEAPARPGWLPQHPPAAFDPAWSVLRSVAEPLRLSGSDAAAAREQAIALIRVLGLDPAHAARRPRELSGGELRRAALARALIAAPPLLLADEPTAGLDPVATLVLIDLVRDSVEARGTALLWVTHDLGVAAAVAPRLLVLAQGRIVEDGPARQVLSAPVSDSARRLTGAWLPLEPHLARARLAEAEVY